MSIRASVAMGHAAFDFLNSIFLTSNKNRTKTHKQFFLYVTTAEGPLGTFVLSPEVRAVETLHHMPNSRQ